MSLSFLTPLPTLPSLHPPPFISIPFHFTHRTFSSTFPTITATAKPPTITPVVLDDWDDEDDEELEEEEEEEEEEGEMLPLEEMRRWARNKPAGFGQGKVYDVTVEEKIVEEMEKNRVGQLAAKNRERLKSSGLEKNKKLDLFHTAVTPGSTPVRLSNLPRKRKIQRDLKVAFKGFAGIVNIRPAVIGSQKTRDPICRGFAFVDLVSEEAAKRFVNTYSKQNIPFGKIHKQISCDFIKPGQSADATQTFTEPQPTKFGNKLIPRLTALVDATEEESTLLSNDTKALESNFKEMELGIQNLNISPLSDAEDMSTLDEGHVDSHNSMSSVQKQRKASKKKIVKKKSAKTSKLSLPSSVARLKSNERKILTGVFSKYGEKVAAVSD